VNTLEENGIELTYSYGPDQSRYKGIWKNNGTQYCKRIYASGYEINEETVNGVTSTQAISYVSSPGGLCAMYVEENGSGTFYFIHTDHLGSITAVSNANGNVIARQNFDAWGRRRKVQDYSYLPQNTSSTDNGLNNNGTLPQWLYRGYTGHEHLDEFALINMNARLYDPVVGMFLSPDNYIQAPGNTQNYNRYAYCLNNPLKYTDPSGNITYAAIVGFIRGFFSTGQGLNARFNAGFDESEKTIFNSLKLTAGLFTTDYAISGGGRRISELVSRFTWQLPQTVAGYLYNIGRNVAGRTERVEYYHGATVAIKEAGKGGDYLSVSFTLGNYITLANVEDDPDAEFGIGQRSYTLLHEYGHYLQSKDYGPIYLARIGISSGSQDAYWTEHDANQRSAEYFKKHHDFEWNPNIYGKYNKYAFLPGYIERPKNYEDGLSIWVTAGIFGAMGVGIGLFYGLK
jgi:RHS repeat-associated protein